MDLSALTQGKNRSWKWFDDRSGKWSNYGALNNKTIDDAYRAGESSIRYMAALSFFLSLVALQSYGCFLPLVDSLQAVDGITFTSPQ